MPLKLLINSLTVAVVALVAVLLGADENGGLKSCSKLKDNK